MSKEQNSLMDKIVSLSKQRGFIFQSSEIYGGLKSAYDYGPLGVELKRNIMNEWWRSMVHEREDVTGIDASIVMHPKVWHASGHLAGFSDPLVDCLISKERFRADKAPQPKLGDGIELKDGRYGAYVTDGKINATLPKTTSPDDVTLEIAVELIAKIKAKGPTKKFRKKKAK